MTISPPLSLLVMVISSDDWSSQIALFSFLDMYSMFGYVSPPAIGGRSVGFESLFLWPHGSLWKGQHWLRYGAEVWFIVSLGLPMVLCHLML